MTHVADLVHRKLVVETFAGDSEYWRDVYEDRPDHERASGLLQGGAFVNREMVDRKEAVLELVDKHAGQRKALVLDLGCGPGMTLRDILKRGHRVIGADITPEMLGQAKAVVAQSAQGSAQLVTSDAENIPFGDGSFDVVICMGVLQYLETDQKAIGEISRVVWDGGLVILTLPNIFRVNNLLDPYYYLVRGLQFLAHRSPLRKRTSTEALSLRDFSANKDFGNRRYYYGQLSELFARNQLRRVETRGVAFGPLTFWRKQLLPTRCSMRISGLLQKAARTKYLSFLNAFANRWVICLVKAKAESQICLPNIGGQ